MAQGDREGFDWPDFDPRASTAFVRHSMARALTPRARQRAAALIRMERLVARYVMSYSLGVNMHLLGSIERAFPVSRRAIELELRGQGPQRFISVAEKIELGFWTRPDWDGTSSGRVGR